MATFLPMWKAEQLVAWPEFLEHSPGYVNQYIPLVAQQADLGFGYLPTKASRLIQSSATVLAAPHHLSFDSSPSLVWILK